MDGTALSGRLHVIRHGDPAYVTIFGTTEAEYDLEFVGERLRTGYYEGRLFRRPNFEGRIVMRRLANLPPLPSRARPCSVTQDTVIAKQLRIPADSESLRFRNDEDRKSEDPSPILSRPATDVRR